MQKILFPNTKSIKFPLIKKNQVFFLKMNMWLKPFLSYCDGFPATSNQHRSFSTLSAP